MPTRERELAMAAHHMTGLVYNGLRALRLYSLARRLEPFLQRALWIAGRFETRDAENCAELARVALDQPGVRVLNAADPRWLHLFPAGEDNPNAKVTAHLVRLIRADLGSSRDIARHYGISPRTVRDIRARKTWRNV